MPKVDLPINLDYFQAVYQSQIARK